MTRPRILSTVFNLKPPTIQSRSQKQHVTGVLDTPPRSNNAGVIALSDEPLDDDLRLPKLSSLVIVLLTSALLQISFFIIVSSSNEYSEYLGGGQTFSGLVIGIPTVFSGLALIPMMKLDLGLYTRPLHFACASALLGNIIYALAYRAHFLYLILIGRIVQGFGFTFWMYAKRYCSDPRLVGLRRRTTLASYLVIGQGCGFALGPFVGGLLYKVGFANNVFNGYTSPAWVMAGIWAVFWALAAMLYEDEPISPPRNSTELPTLSSSSPAQPFKPQTLSSPNLSQEPVFRASPRQYAAIGTMCWIAMMCFFVLGAWEANIPVFGRSSASTFHWSPFAAGNFIAIGGGAVFPLLFANLWFARRFQDRYVLALGTALGAVGLLIMLALVRASAVNYGSFFVCWFLIALGFNLASTCTISLLSKQLPGTWNGKISLAIQYSNYLGRVTGAVWGGAGVHIGMLNYLGLELAIVGIGALMFTLLWKDLKAKTG